MKRIFSLSSLLMTFLLVTTGTLLAGQDPGARDIVSLYGGPLVVGQSKPLSLSIRNDYPLAAYTLEFILTTSDSGSARYDSVVYVNRMSDPSVMSFRVVHPYSDGVLPDTLFLGGMYMGAADQGLPPGNSDIVQIYFTGISSGTMEVDSGTHPPSGFVLCGKSSIGCYAPQWTPYTITIATGTLPPTMSVPTEPLRRTVGSNVQFEVSGSSPEGFPVTLSLLSMSGFDDGTRLPAASPTLSSGNPAGFNWLTTASDIGIWLATFKVCDSAGVCVTKSVEIQVVQNAGFLVSFNVAETPNICNATGLLHGRFDADDAPELYLTGTAAFYTSTVELYDYTTSQLQRVYEYSGSPNFSRVGPQVGYFNDDPYLDVLHMRNGTDERLVLHLGDGNNGFTRDEHNAGGWAHSSALGEFNGDNHLDVAFAWFDGVTVYTGDGQMNFTPITSIAISESTLTVNSADFNSDGHDDLAVGTKSGVRIYLGDGSGGFTLANSYSQTYGSTDIEVTNQGSDFNNDNLYDLCVSTPSVGGTSSQMMVYLGHGDGSFSQQSVRTVKGQIFGNTVGDFNDDGNLDIAFVNGAKRYAAILFGDGNGSFANEIRYAIPFPNPAFIDALDIDLDGDLDLAVVANGLNSSNSLFLLTNQLNPGGFAQKKLDIAARDNSRIELVSATGKVFNEIKNTMSSAALYKRNLDQNNIIDNYAMIGVVEPTEYALSAKPRPNLPVGQPYTLEFTIDNQHYRLARNMPMPSSGVKFGVYLGDASGVMPRPGAFVLANPPAFNWQGTGQFDFQLATDVDFSDLIVDRLVSGNILTLTTPLAVTDTTSYYWRVKPHASPQFNSIFVLNLVPAAAPSCGDADGSGAVDISDAVSMIGYIFASGTLPNPGSADTNCDSAVDISDAVLLINYIFGGGLPPCDGC